MRRFVFSARLNVEPNTSGGMMGEMKSKRSQIKHRFSDILMSLFSPTFPLPALLLFFSHRINAVCCFVLGVCVGRSIHFHAFSISSVYSCNYPVMEFSSAAEEKLSSRELILHIKLLLLFVFMALRLSHSRRHPRECWEINSSVGAQPKALKCVMNNKLFSPTFLTLTSRITVIISS